MPSPLPRQVGWNRFARTLSIHIGLPQYLGGWAPALIVSRPAQRLLTLRPARSRNRLAILSIESSDSFLASAAVSIATGWSELVPGRELHPLKSSAFSRRTIAVGTPVARCPPHRPGRALISASGSSLGYERPTICSPHTPPPVEHAQARTVSGRCQVKECSP